MPTVKWWERDTETGKVSHPRLPLAFGGGETPMVVCIFFSIPVCL